MHSTSGKRKLAELGGDDDRSSENVHMPRKIGRTMNERTAGATDGEKWRYIEMTIV